MKRNLNINCLLVIDVQDKCVHDCFAHDEFDLELTNVQRTVPKIEKLVEFCREQKIEVIWILTTPWTKRHLPGNMVELYESNPDATFYDKDPASPEPILDTKDELIFRKNNYSAFGGTKGMLENYLNAKLYTRLGICGVYSTGCVDRTIGAAQDRGFFNVIFRDCVETFDDCDAEHEGRILHWELNDGHVTTISEFINFYKETDMEDKKKTMEYSDKMKSRLSQIKDYTQSTLFESGYIAGYDYQKEQDTPRREADAGFEEQCFYEEGFALGKDEREEEDMNMDVALFKQDNPDDYDEEDDAQIRQMLSD